MCTKMELFQRKMQLKVYFGGLHEEMERCKGRYGQKRSILNEDVYKNGVA